MLKQRNGKRHNINYLFGVVVYSRLGMPDFSNDFEINCGGMRFNASIDYKCGELVVVKLFMEGKFVLELYGVYHHREDDSISLVKFEPLRDKQRLILCRLLEQASAA